MSNQQTIELTKKDFVSDQDVRWCPGCGDYAILSQVQKVFPQLGVPKEKFLVVSGIGCSSRFPYYMDSFGFHSIHEGFGIVILEAQASGKPVVTTIAGGTTDIIKNNKDGYYI